MIHGRIIRYAVAVAIAGASWAASAAVQEAVPGEFVVKVKNNEAMLNKNAMAIHSAQTIRPIAENLNLFLVKRNMLEAESFAISKLQADDNVVFAEPNYIYRINKLPNDPGLSELWGLKNDAQKGGRAGIDIGAEKAWDIETGSDKVVVAVIDTGVDYTHPDLAENIWTNEAELNGQAGVDDDNNGYVDDIHGYDFANKDGDPIDDHGHGTHCSGTIGARGNDGKGIVGVNWNVKIMGVKFLTADGSGTLEDAILAINYATKMGAMIESNSWGGGGFTQALKDVIQEAESKNVLFVAAAGNNSSDNDETPSYPASYDVPNVVSVAAIDNSGALAYFSNYGAKTVHVAAPGVDVYSTVKDGGYDTYSGTSMATPHVAGIAALLKAHNANMNYKQIKETIMNSAVKLGTVRSKVVSGLANAFYALSGEESPVDSEDPYNWESVDYSVESAHPYKKNENKEFMVKVDGAKKISVLFNEFKTEQGYDYVEFFDKSGASLGKWSGNHAGEFSPVAIGDTLRMVLTSDTDYQEYGFDIKKVAIK